MDLYTLDDSLRREEVVDGYESLIWTERWQEAGDFDLDIRSTEKNRERFSTGRLLAKEESDRVMIVEMVEDYTDSENRSMLKITGSSLEIILNERVAKQNMDNLDDNPSWSLQGWPTAIAANMFNTICYPPGALSSNDEIPYLVEATNFPEENIPRSTAIARWEQRPDSLYSAMVAVSKTHDFGFRLIRINDDSELYFHVYMGNDRTTKQTELNPVIFGPEFENIQNTKELSSIKDFKNVAYVFSNEGSRVVFADGVSSNISGFDRRVMVLTVSLSGDELTDVQNSLARRGRAALKNQEKKSLYDGEVDPILSYKYGVDYEIGDLVELRDIYSNINYKRITEHISVSNKEGRYSYPTLAEGRNHMWS